MASEQLKRVLDRFDLNQDGVIAGSEFQQALADEGVPADTAKLIFEKAFGNWDTDGDNKLSKSELDALARKWASF